MNRILRLIIIPIITLVTSQQLSITSCFAQSARYVRVAIIQDAASLSLKVGGLFEIIDTKKGTVIFRGKNLKSTVIGYKGGVSIGKNNFKTDKITIRTNDQDVIIINGRTFRGDILLIKKDATQFLVVNNIELEDYIKGILYNEVSHYWPQEALKAQAIVCRTYAVYQKQENTLRDYDVTGDIYSQVYGGRASERYRTNKAVKETKGLILTYQGKIISAYYHATCAGHTEDASVLWKIEIAPLKGVPCNFCQGSPHFKWHCVLSQDKIEEKLRAAGYNVKNIKDIMILGRNSSGRVSGLKISSDDKEINISAKDFRNVVGPNIIRSTNFKVSLANQDVIFEGFGWGHGVGLCQWGAYFMAKQGYNYKDILKYYYPGSEVSLK